eukprot:5219650-Amphidinium_carterae.2
MKCLVEFIILVVEIEVQGSQQFVSSATRIRAVEIVALVVEVDVTAARTKGITDFVCVVEDVVVNVVSYSCVVRSWHRSRSRKLRVYKTLR